MGDKDSFFNKNYTINAGGKLITLSKPLVMGILNTTPDSFFDGGNYQNEKEIEKRISTMIEDGADIIDIGGMSSRPGSETVDSKTEINRIEYALTFTAKNFPDTLISVDTYRSDVAKFALDKGTHIINDISAGEIDPEIIKVAAAYKVPYILMHMQGNPANMQKNPQYKDVLADVFKFLLQKTEQLSQSGINDIIIDPGFGFGKTMEHNFKLLAHLDYFKNLNRPILAGTSRKSMLCKALNIKPENALNASSWSNTISLLKGADILRVHDVKEAVQVCKLHNLLDEYSQPD
ncbi:MAG: dihydropteroate synthase [Chitinophagaceae bacterium]|nr:MAG: dihydropteroate synthase [Chitinophagaceae bacterium]